MVAAISSDADDRPCARDGETSTLVDSSKEVQPVRDYNFSMCAHGKTDAPGPSSDRLNSNSRVTVTNSELQSDLEIYYMWPGCDIFVDKAVLPNFESKPELAYHAIEYAIREDNQPILRKLILISRLFEFHNSDRLKIMSLLRTSPSALAFFKFNVRGDPGLLDFAAMRDPTVLWRAKPALLSNLALIKRA